MAKTKEEVLDLTVVLTGEIVESNLPAFKEKALAVIKAADRPLVTTNDFDDAATTVKKCKEAESALVAAKEKALNQTVDIKALFDTMDEISAELKKTRLSLDKKVKKRKVEIRDGIINSAYGRFCDAFEVVAKKTPEVRNSTKVNRVLFEDAVSGKSNIENMEKAVDAVLNGELHILDKFKALIQGNKELIAKCEYQSLFPDVLTLVCKPSPEVQLTLDSRVSKHILEEKERKEKAEAAAKAEADRKAKEEEALAEVKAREDKGPSEIAQQQPKEEARTESKPESTPNFTNTSGRAFREVVGTTATQPPESEEIEGNYIVTVNLTCTLTKAKETARDVRTICGNASLTKG